MDEDEFEIGATDTGQQRSVRAPRGPQLRRPPRGVTVGLIVACVVVVTAGLALASVPNLSGRVDVLLHGTPTATPRIAPGGNLFYVEGAVPWGALEIDGKAVTVNLPGSITSAAQYVPRGVHVITYRADPFPVLRCRLSVPASKSDNCPLDASYTFPSLPAGLLNYAARALDLTPTLDTLQAPARAALQQTISAYVAIKSGPTTVQPGERYVNADHQIVYADQALTATLTQALATGVSSTSNGCAVLCMPAPARDGYPPAVADLVVDAHVTQHFSYSTAAGQVVLADAPIASRTDEPNDEVVSLMVTWSGGWQVALEIPTTQLTAQPYTPACLAGTQALSHYLFDSRDNIQIIPIEAEIPSANPADGCVFRFSGASAYGGSPTASDFLHLFYRFGVVMVVNDVTDAQYATFSLFGAFPFTDDAETALAQQIDATQPYS